MSSFRPMTEHGSYSNPAIAAAEPAGLLIEAMTGGGTLTRSRRRPPADARPARVPARTPLPKVETGELWLMALPSDGVALPPAVQRVLGAVNVVIYDRALAPAVAAALSLGSYAEPAADQPGDVAAVERCFHFVRDGWSVARLIDSDLAAPERAARLNALAGRLRAGGAANDLPVRVFADAGGGAFEASETSFGRLDIAIASGGAGVHTVTVFGAISPHSAPAHSAVSANGLAG